VSLLEEALTESRNPGPACHVARACTEHPTKADDIGALIRERRASAAAAARVFARHDIRIAANVVTRHRAGGCNYCTTQGVTW